MSFNTCSIHHMRRSTVLLLANVLPEIDVHEKHMSVVKSIQPNSQSAVSPLPAAWPYIRTLGP